MQEAFNTGDYINAVVSRQKAENISSVLFPDDRSHQVCVLFVKLVIYILENILELYCCLLYGGVAVLSLFYLTGEGAAAETTIFLCLCIHTRHNSEV
jgi:hypothetical protein